MQDAVLSPIFLSTLIPGVLPAEFGIFGVSFTTASVLSTATLLAGSVALSILLRPEAPKPEVGTQPVKQSIPPRFYGFGEVRLGGGYVLAETINGLALTMVGICQGPIGGFKKFYLSDKGVGVAPDGAVQRFSDGAYEGGIAHIYARPGRKLEVAHTISELDGEEDLWTEDHRGDRVANLFLRQSPVDAADLMKRYPDGVPKPSSVVFLPCWDFRDPSQDPDDSDTWIDYEAWDDDTAYVAGDRVLYGGIAVSGLDAPGGQLWLALQGSVGTKPGSDARYWAPVWKNPVLQIVTYLMSPDIGMGLSRTRLITPMLTDLTAEAAKCDAAVARRVGYEPRYSACPWYRLDTNPEEVLGLSLAACDGWAGLNGDGGLVVKVGVYEAPPATAVLTEDEIIDVEIAYGKLDEDKIDELTLSVVSPAHDYTTQEVPPWRNEDAILSRGQIRSKAFGPASIQSYTQLRRLAKPMMTRANAQTCTITTHLGGLVAAGQRYARIEYSLLPELDGKMVEIRTRRTSWRDRRCTFECVILDPETLYDWDPATEEGDPPAIVLPMPDTSIGGVSDITGFATIADDITRLELRWKTTAFTAIGATEGGSTAFTFLLRYRLTDDGTGSPSLWQYVRVPEWERDGAFFIATVFPTVSGDEYQVEVAAVSGANTRGNWSSAVYLSAIWGLNYSRPQNAVYAMLMLQY